MRQMSAFELGWLTGLIDGDGTIVYHPDCGPRLTVALIDEDTIQRCFELTGVGRYQYRPAKGNARGQYSWNVSRRSEFWALLALMYPYFSVPRQDKILLIADRMGLEFKTESDLTHDPVLVERGWGVGLFEAEGCVGHEGASGVRLALGMNDENAVLRFQKFCNGAGPIYKRIRSNGQSHFVLQIGAHDDILPMLNFMFPHLSQRKQTQATGALQRMALYEDRTTTFICRHPRTPDNVYKTQRRNRREGDAVAESCRTCTLERQGAKQKEKTALRQTGTTRVCEAFECKNLLTGLHGKTKFCSPQCYEITRKRPYPKGTKKWG